MRSEFLNRSSIKVAKDLLGCFLCRKINGKIYKYKITETEAYGGINDLASHARRGRTKSNAPMFAEAGTIYVYFTYGMHYMLNIVTGKKDHPSAVLIRGVEGIIGPGRLTRALHIDKMLNNKMLGRKTGLWIEIPNKKEELRINKTPRIGIDYSGPIWSKKLHRFVIKNNYPKTKPRLAAGFCGTYIVLKK
jgi:DNA-3-methyladenine glycosylase